MAKIDGKENRGSGELPSLPQGGLKSMVLPDIRSEIWLKAGAISVNRFRADHATLVDHLQ